MLPLGLGYYAIAHFHLCPVNERTSGVASSLLRNTTTHSVPSMDVKEQMRGIEAQVQYTKR